MITRKQLNKIWDEGCDNGPCHNCELNDLECGVAYGETEAECKERLYKEINDPLELAIMAVKEAEDETTLRE